MRAPPVFVSALATVLLAAASGPAAAQSAVSITLNQTFVTRDVPDKGNNLYRYWINRADCLADDVLHFQTTVTGAVLSGSRVLEVWASQSADCTQAFNRGIASNSCWLVFQNTPSSLVYRVDIRAQNIVAQNFPSTGEREASAAACAAGTAVDRALKLHFMIVEGSQMVGTPAVWEQTGFDVQPPEPPFDVSVEPGKERLLVNWRTTTIPDLLEWRFYCDQAPNGCPDSTPALVPGQVPAEAYRCGTVVGDITRSGHAVGLPNDVDYAVGVLATDKVGNVGELSELACAAPELHAEDVPAPGRSCSISHGDGVTPFVEMGAVSLVGLGLASRRKRNV